MLLLLSVFLEYCNKTYEISSSLKKKKRILCSVPIFSYFCIMKRAIVMGASSGMGQEVSKLLLQDGWNVGIAARRLEELEALAAAYPGKVEVMQIDVTDPDAPRLLLELIDRLGGVGLYFHASGVGKQNMSLDAAIEERTVMTNAVGFTRMVDTVFNYMASHQGGDIAVISSIAGTKGLGAAPSYSATKSFQNLYIQALEQQAHMRDLPIRFTDIRPGFVDTPLLGDGHRYPLLMSKEKVAREILEAIHRHQHVRVIDWRYRILVPLWRLIPNCLWRRLKVKS
jgi:NADP-dependent 3-hydroxy acid dehydrogenase YdfG